MFTVRWERSALDELTNLWLGANSTMRAAITAATNELDEDLQTDPVLGSETREGGDRVRFAFPLGIRFEIDEEQHLVSVLQVWSFRRRKR